jgi:tetratricopeptide (TPR) repeat protein
MDSKQNDQELAKLREAAGDGATDPADRMAAAELLAEAGSTAEAVPAFLNAGRDFMDAGDVENARACFVRAAALEPKNYDALFEIGRADLANGKRDDALAKFVEVLRKTSLRHMPALFETGCLYESLGKYDEAILAFKRIVERDKTHVDGLDHLGRVHQAKNLKAEAVSYYNLAADAAFAAGRTADARRCANASLALEPDNAKAKGMIASIKAAPAPEPAPGPKPQPKPAAATPVAAPVQSVAAPAQSLAAQPPPAAPQATAPAAPQAAAPAQPVAAAPVQPSTPAPAAAAPARPADDSPVLSSALPAEVFLLEQQSEAMSRLAQAKSEVAQAFKKRMAVEEEIKAAKAALEALERERTTVEGRLGQLKGEVDSAAQAKAAEDASLVKLAADVKKVRDELAALASLPNDVAAIRAKVEAVAGQVSKANEALAASQARAEQVMAETGAVETNVNDLQNKFAAARQGADAVEKQLVGLLEQTRGVHATAKSAADQVTAIRADVTALKAMAAELSTSRSRLEADAKSVEVKHAEAVAALKRVDEIRAARLGESATIDPAPARPTQPAAAKPATAAAAPAPADTAKKTNGTSSAASVAGPGTLASEADALRAARNFAAAVEKYKSALALDASNVSARYGMGLALNGLGKPVDAIAALRPLENDKSYGVLARTALANAMRAGGDLDGAEACLSQALELTGYPEEHYRQALYALAALHESKGDPDSLGLALWSYEEIVSGDPGFADAAARVEKIKAVLAAPEGRNGAK